MLMQCDRAAQAYRSTEIADLSAYLVDIADLQAAIAVSFEADRHRDSKRRRAAIMNEKRHAPAREARRLVIEDWLKDRSRFAGADPAGRFYVDWLKEQGFSIDSPRTISEWIRATAKEKRIRLR